jgi:hypothetical protein
MVGDVTFQLLSRMAFEPLKRLSEIPAEVLRQMIGKNGIDIGQSGIDNNPWWLQRKINFDNAPLVRTLSTFKN